MARPRTLRVLITAGPTREYLDPVRYLSNASSGKMGFALAEEALRRGLRVTLVHGPVALDPPAGVQAVAVVSAHDMLAACRRLWPRHDALIMAAAVSDYTPARPWRTKRKKSSEALTLRLRPTPDILAELAGARRPGQIVVGFALEDRAPRRYAERKMSDKKLDAIVLNGPAAIGRDRSTAEIKVLDEPWRPLPRSKSRQAAAILDALQRLATHPPPAREMEAKHARRR